MKLKNIISQEISSPLSSTTGISSDEQSEKTQVPIEDLINDHSNNTVFYRKHFGRLIAFIAKWYKQFMAQIRAEGSELRKSVTSDDVLILKRARLLFHLCSILPPLTYYFSRGYLAVDRPPKFPATISFTIRKGLPKKIQTILWAGGWALMYRLIHRRTKHASQHFYSSLLRRYTLQMIGTGVCTIELFPLGKSDTADIFHFMGAAKYMLDHIILMDVLKMKPLYRKMFFWSFGMLVLNCGVVRSIEVLAGIAKESDTSVTTAQRAKQISQKLSPPARSRLFLSELLVMLFENLLFSSFVQGIPSGLEEEGNKEEPQCQKHDKELNKMETAETTSTTNSE